MSSINEQIAVIEIQAETLKQSYSKDEEWSSDIAKSEYEKLNEACANLKLFAKLQHIPLRKLAAETMKVAPETMKTTPCKWCDKPTPMLGTRECDGCHEIRVRSQNALQSVLVNILTNIRPDLIVLIKEHKYEQKN